MKLIKDNILHYTSLTASGERETPFTSPIPKHKMNTLKNSTLQREAESSAVPTGVRLQFHQDPFRSDGPLTTLYCCSLANRSDG